MKRRPARRHLRRLLLGAAAALLSAFAHAQDAWPSRPIKLIVPFAPGGSNDSMSRVLAAKLSARLGQPVVIENKDGAGGTIGTEFVAKAPADGYTLLFASASIVTNSAIGKKLRYDPVKDLAPIGLIAASPFAIVVANSVKATTLKEFIELARAQPKTLNYGSAGIGGMNHLGAELFASTARVQLVHVPYKGIAPAFNDLMAGNLQMLLPSLASSTVHMRAGKMRGLAVTGSQRSPLAPDLPTVAEAGLPGFQLEVWFGIMGPARLPPATIKRLNEELNAALALPDVKELFAREGATPRPGTPDDFHQLIGSEMVRWTRLIKETGIQAE